MRKYAPLEVILTLLRQPSECSVRELARKASVSSSTAKEVLDLLYELKVVSLKIVGNTYQYQLDTSYFLTRQIKVLTNIFELARSRILSEILMNKGIISVILYGSAARGTDDARSDFDVSVISDKKLKLALGKVKTSREINVSCYTMQEWREKAKRDKVFYESVITNCVPLYGEVPVV